MNAIPEGAPMGNTERPPVSNETIERIKALLLTDEYDFLNLDEHKAAVLAIRLKLRAGVIIYVPEVHKVRFAGRWVLDGPRLRDLFISWEVMPAEVPELKNFKSFVKEYEEDIEHEIEVLKNGRQTQENGERGNDREGLLDIRQGAGADIRL